MKKKLCIIFIIYLCIFCPAVLVKAAEVDLTAKENAEEDQTIYVGWYEREGYFEKNNEGMLSGFGYDYLMAISSYTGWEYKFLEGTRTECITWLENGEIDLMSPINADFNSSKIYVASEVIGEDYGYLYKKSNNSLIKYEDFANFNRATVGVNAHSGLEEQLQEYCEDHKFQFHDVIVYPTLEEMKQGLADGEIDLLLTDAYVNIENMKVVGRFSHGRATFASSRQEIIEKLNDAMEEIKLNNPDYTKDLGDTYFSKSSQNNLEYSAAEGEFLKTDRSYNLILCKEQYPISYRAAGEEEQKGVAIELLERIEYQTGLRFNIIYEDTYRQGIERLTDGEIRIVGGGIVFKQDSEVLGGENIGNDREKKKYNVGFYDVRLGLVGEKGMDPHSRLTVAIPDYLEEAAGRLVEIYPYYRFIAYKNSEACLAAVIAKEADGAILSDVAIQELTVYEIYQNLQIQQHVPGNFTAVFTIYTKDKVLVDIIRKALHNIPTATVAEIENDNIYHLATRDMTIDELWDEYKNEIITVLISMAALFGFWKYLAERKAKEKAYYDSVAKVSSMEKLRIDFSKILASEEKTDYFVMAVDIDKFKVINDLYGYAMGDRTIAFLGKVLKEKLTIRDFVARSNADNFIVIKKAEKQDEISRYLDLVYRKIDEEINKNTIHYHLTVKAGIYRITRTDDNLSSIIDKANLAKLNIRQIYESSYQFYDEEMRRKNIEEKYLENDMESALKNGEFCIYLQPQIDLKTDKIVSAEALVRWISPQKGMIPPGKFIPVFEKNGFVTRLDRFVWEEAAGTVRKWLDEGKKAVPIAINLSGIDVQTEGMLEALVFLMDKYRLEGSWIKTELTESICLESDHIIMDKMNQLKKAGFTIAIDDFGAGYSSFYLLKEMPIHILKIDKSFLEFDFDEESKHMVVLKDVINLGKHLNLQIIMEGVETEEQVRLLKAFECDIAQGYYYSKPVSVPEFEELLKKQEEMGGTKG